MGSEARRNGSASLSGQALAQDRRIRELEQRNGEFVQAHNALCELVAKLQRQLAAVIAGNQDLVDRVGDLEVTTLRKPEFATV